MLKNLYTKVFLWLFVGLLFTFISAYGMSLVIYNVEGVAETLFKGVGMILLVIIEVIIAIILGLKIRTLSPITTKLLYLLYSCITGITLSAVLIYFQSSSIIFIFLITSILFLVFAIIGSKLNINLSKFGPYLLISLIGTIVAEIINIFLHNTALEMLLSAIIIVVFTLYIGYDIKLVEALSSEDIEEDKVAVYGAFQLYLDFINLFVRLLELFGKSRD